MMHIDLHEQATHKSHHRIGLLKILKFGRSRGKERGRYFSETKQFNTGVVPWRLATSYREDTQKVSLTSEHCYRFQNFRGFS